MYPWGYMYPRLGTPGVEWPEMGARGPLVTLQWEYVKRVLFIESFFQIFINECISSSLHLQSDDFLVNAIYYYYWSHLLALAYQCICSFTAENATCSRPSHKSAFTRMIYRRAWRTLAWHHHCTVQNVSLDCWKKRCFQKIRLFLHFYLAKHSSWEVWDFCWIGVLLGNWR